MSSTSALLLLVQVGLVVCGHGVPVLLWTSADLPNEVPVPLAGHSLRQRDFQDTYLKALSPGKVLVAFVQDELGLEDFLQYRNAFKSVQGLMQPERSLTFPSVFDPMAAVRSEAAGGGHSTTLELSDPEEAERLLPLLQLDANSALFVRLHRTSGAATAASMHEAMQRNDALMDKVVGRLAEAALPYVAVYTTHKLRAARDAIIQGAGRRLLATAANGTQSGIQGFLLTGSTVNASACAMLYVDSISLRVQLDPTNSSWTTAVFDKTYLNGSIQCYCGAIDNVTKTAPPCAPMSGNSSLPMPNITSAVINLYIPGPYHTVNSSLTINTFSISLTMALDTRYTSKWWVAKQMVVKLDNTSVTYVNNPELDAITAPMQASYHCWKQPSLYSGSPSSLPNDTSYWANCTGPICYSNAGSGSFRPFYLTFTNLQVQALKLKTAAAFGGAYDCASFFTIPTWMGLLTALILIVISLFGITMLAKIETFDQFDDAKGKTIVVTNTE